jgi:hypothetical protein
MSHRLGCLLQELARFVAALLSVALVVLIPLVVYSAVFDRTLFHADFYKASLARHDAYETLPPALIDEVVQRTLMGSAPGALSTLLAGVEAEDWQPIVRDAAPPDWLRGVMEGGIDQLFAWMGTNDPYPTIPIPIGPIRDRLRTGPGGRQLVGVLLRNQPPCTPEQLQAALGTGALPICAPPANLRDRVTALILPQVDAFIGQIITTVQPGADPAARDIDLVAAMRARIGGDEVFQQLRLMRTIATSVRLATPLGMATILLFLGLIHLIAVRSWHGWAQWLGLLMFLAGSLTLLPLLLVPAWLDQSLAEAAAQPITDRPLLAIIQLGQWLAADFSAEMWRLAGIAGAAMVLLGLLLLILSIFLPSARPEDFDDEWEEEAPPSGGLRLRRPPPAAAPRQPSYDE